METCLLVQYNSNKKVKFIELIWEATTVARKWGLLGGKIQSTSNTYSYINEGKANQLTPEQAAEADFKRVISTKIKEGYVEVNSLTEAVDTLASSSDIMDFNNIPSQFCCSKPNVSITEKKLAQYIKTNSGKFFIKENGLCHYILITSNNDVKIYTRRIEDHTRKYPKMCEYIKSKKLPANTLLITEFFIDPKLGLPHLESFNIMSSISKSDAIGGLVKDDITKTLALQEQYPVAACLFNVLFYDSEDLTKLSYDVVYTKYILSLTSDNNTLLSPRLCIFNNSEEVWKWAADNSSMYEGLVLWDMHKNSEISYNGKPNRRAAYKIKSTKEDDVVAYGWEEGSGDKQGKIGALLIGKYSNEGEIIPMGKCGSGLTDIECDPDSWEFPCVIEIKYDQRFPTGAYQFPRFVKKHGEKIPKEVIVDSNGR